MDDNTTVSWETSQAAQKQMEYKNVNHDGQKQQNHQNTYTCTAESLHAAQRKGKKVWMEERKSNSITRKRRERHHSQTEKAIQKAFIAKE